MRPLDDKGTTHPTYDATFDTTTGAPLLSLMDFKHHNNTSKDAIYTFFRNGFVFPNGEQGGVRPKVPPDIQPLAPYAVGVFPNYAIMPPITFPVPNRDNTAAQITLHPIFQPIQETGNVTANNPPIKVTRRIRLLLPANEAAELLRLLREDRWNSVNVPAPARVVVFGTAQERKKLEDALHDEIFRTGVRARYQYRGYKGAKNELMLRMGSYCAYCETKQQNGRDTPIEHRIPKEEYCTETLRWDNFVLGCNLCNSDFKGTQPDRNFGIKMALSLHYAPVALPVAPPKNNAPAPIVTPPDGVLPYYHIRNAAEQYTLWPDVDDGGPIGWPGVNVNQPKSLSFYMCKYELWETDNQDMDVGTGPIPMANAVHLQNTFELTPVERQQLQGGTGRALLAKVWDNGALRLMWVRVKVRTRQAPTNNAAFDARKQAATTETIRIVGLNKSNDLSSDLRVLARTEAWFKAIEAVRGLQTVETNAQQWLMGGLFTRLQGVIGGPPVRYQVALTRGDWDTGCSRVETEGLYSVWVTVFKHHDVRLASKLVQELDTRARNNPHRFWSYHGTDIQHSMLPLIPKV